MGGSNSTTRKKKKRKKRSNKKKRGIEEEQHQQTFGGENLYDETFETTTENETFEENTENDEIEENTENEVETNTRTDAVVNSIDENIKMEITEHEHKTEWNDYLTNVPPFWDEYWQKYSGQLVWHDWCEKFPTMYARYMKRKNGEDDGIVIFCRIIKVLRTTI